MRPWPGRPTIFLALFALFSWLSAGDLRGDNAPLRIGVTPVFPPMIFKQGKELAGVEVDLARSLGAHLGRSIIFVELPWNDQIDALNARRTDIIMSSMSVTAPRQFVINFSQPYLKVGQMALVRRVDLGNYATGFPLTPQGTLGALKGTTGDFLAQREFAKTRRKTFNTGTEAALALKKGKIDLFISDSTLVWYLAGIHAADGLAAVPTILSEETVAWGLRKGDDALLVSVNQFIEKARQEETFKRIFQRWTAVGP